MDRRALHIHLLGGFLLVDNGVPVVTLRAPRLQALLSLLVIKRATPLPRQHLAFCLWPGSSEAQAQTNLRNLLHQIRQLLPHADDYLLLNGRTVQWRNESPFTVDIASFEQAICQAEQALRHGDHRTAQTCFEAAIRCYRGDLLLDCYDEWILPERERLRQIFIAALGHLTTLLESQRDYPTAIQHAHHLLQIEPLHEATYLQLMRLHVLDGNRAAAIQIYHVCCERLQHDLVAEPGQPLRDAYMQIMRRGATARLPQAAPLLVGRQREWARLLQCWQSAASGQAQLVVLAGEAGIGKTRLAEELLRWASRQGLSTASAQCPPGEGELIYAPIIAWLRAQPVRSMFATLAPVWLAEIARLLPELHEERPDLPPAGPLSEPWQRQRLFEALRRAVLAAGQPLLLHIDDLQWCDNASLEWLHYMLHDKAPIRLLVISTVRLEEVDASSALADLIVTLRARGHASTIDLMPLDSAETADLAAQVVGHPLTLEQGAAVYRETEGNPLFVVEMLRAGGELQGARTLGGVDELGLPDLVPLPARVQAVIARRLAQLSPLARDLACVAAAIGCVFTFSLLAIACGDLHEDALVRGLDELWKRRIIREHPDGTYDFSHTKLREVAYHEISAARRGQLQRRIAESQEPDEAERQV
ncbi:MAG: AAA family ATPase [Chloroflexales bacterium]